MTRRLTLAIVGMVAAGLLVAGAGTFLLLRFGERAETQRDLRDRAGEVADALEAIPPRQLRGQAQGLRRALRLDDIAVVTVGATVEGELPDGVVLSDRDIERLGRGEVVSGVRAGRAYAAAPLDIELPQAEQTAVVVLTERVDAGLGPALRWFVAAAAVTLVVAAVVAATVGRRLTQSLRTAEAATRRIAAGDLSTRVPEPAPGDDDEVAGLSRSINAMADALARSRGLEQQFLLSVSHDLRTPLTSIRGYAEAIADGAVADQAAAAGVILAEARRLERLVHDLLDLAKLEAHQFSFTLGPVDLADVASGTVDGFRPEAEDDGVVLEVRAPGPGPVVRGDPDRLAQVVANLVENALRHARHRVVVEVEAAGDGGGRATLAVSDDGAGIAAEDLPHVFERLYVARHQPRRRESGSGLGLAIVRELVTAMGGAVAAEPPVPGGPGGARLVVQLTRPDEVPGG